MNKFIIGLILGVAIAAGVAYYLNNMPNQFENKASNNTSGGFVASSGPIVLAPGTKIEEVPSNGQTADASAPSYDFYDILQGSKDASSAPQSSVQSSPKHTSYMVQAGQFKDASLADNMLARITLLGIDADIKTESSDGQMLHSVIIGPFNTESQAKQVVDRLAAEEIPTKISQVNH